MLLEALTYLVTPCPPIAWRLGFSRELVSIISRHGRCHKAWAPHLENSRNVVRRAIKEAKNRRRVVVLGAGLGYDLPLADLAEAYMGLADPQKAADCFAEARRVLAQSSEDGNEPSVLAQLGVMVAEGRVALRRGALDEAIAVLQAGLHLSERHEAKEYELEINDLLATAFKRSGRFEEALDRREAHDAQYRQMFTHAADLRLRTLQVAHETATARHEAEIFRLRTQDVEHLVHEDPLDPIVDPVTTATHHLEAFHQLAVLMEFRDNETGEHTERVGDLAAEIAHAGLDGTGISRFRRSISADRVSGAAATRRPP